MPFKNKKLFKALAELGNFFSMRQRKDTPSRVALLVKDYVAREESSPVTSHIDHD